MKEKTSEKIERLLVGAKVLSLNQISKELNIPISTISRAIKKIPGIFLKRRREGRSHVKYASLVPFILSTQNQFATSNQLASAEQPQPPQLAPPVQLASPQNQLAVPQQVESPQLANPDPPENSSKPPNLEMEAKIKSKRGSVFATALYIKDDIRKMHGQEELIIELIRGIEERNLSHFLMLNKLPFAEVQLNLQLAYLFKEIIREEDVPIGAVLRVIPKLQYLPRDVGEKPAESPPVSSEDKEVINEALKVLAWEGPEGKKRRKSSAKQPS